VELSKRLNIIRGREIILKASKKTEEHYKREKGREREEEWDIQKHMRLKKTGKLY